VICKGEEAPESESDDLSTCTIAFESAYRAALVPRKQGISCIDCYLNGRDIND